VEEWHERGSDRSCGFRDIVDVELARFDALADESLEDRHHPLDIRLDDRPVLLCVAATINSCMGLALTSIILLWR
jgi:hypothetical protein